MVDQWAPSLDANLLALGLARRAPPPVSTFAAVHAKFAAFERTYVDLLKLARRSSISIDELDALTNPPLSQTLDEYEDFKYDAENLRRGARSFTKRALDVPDLPYKVARYVYTDSDIKQLHDKIDRQILIMDGKLNDVVLSYYIHLYRRSQASSSHGDYDSGLFSSPLRGSQDQSPTELQFGPSSKDDRDITSLWDRLNKVNSMLTPTSPHVQSSINSSGSPQRLSAAEMSQVKELLKARLHKAMSSTLPVESMTDVQLVAYSQDRLKTLLSSFPDFATRKRVYFRDELQNSRNISKLGRDQNPAIDMRSAATMKIQPTKYKFRLLTLDIVRSQKRTIIVCTDESKGIGILHFLPRHPFIYPSTDTRKIDSASHDKEVSFEEESYVQLTGSINDSVRQAIPVYNFSLKSEMFAFQSALMGKLIRHAFDVDSVESKRGSESSLQQLKIWSDFNNQNFSLSFYVNKKLANKGYLEFPLQCFNPTPLKNQDTKKAQLIRLYFRVQAEPIKPKRLPRDSISEVPSSTDRILAGRIPSFRNPFNSNKALPTLSMFRRNSKTSHHSEKTLPLSPPAGSIGQRSSSSSGSIGTQSTDYTAMESVVSVSPALDLNIHSDAKTLQFLDIKFSILTDAEAFMTEFVNATKMSNQSRRWEYMSQIKPITVTSMTKSPKPTHLVSPTVSDIPELSLPPAMGTFPHVDKGLWISLPDDSQPHLEDASISAQAFTPGDHQPAPVRNRQRNGAIIPDVAYRVRGIPIKYQVGELRNFMASKFDIEQSEIDVRSLAANPDRKSQTAIVVFETVPSEILSGKDNWSFRWSFFEGMNPSHIKIDRHFDGLTMLYNPPENTNHEIDICAVAGLGDSAFEAFEEKGRGGSYMWVLDLLQDYFAGARIMLYGCHAKSSGNGPSRALEILARELIDGINSLDDDGKSTEPYLNHDGPENVPLIFIGYSLAGQIIKQAMVIAESQPDDDKFYRSIYGALFFGVPSGAMEINALETVLKDQAGYFREMSNQSDAELFNKNFDLVINSKDLNMHYFYETEKTPRLKKRLKEYQREGTEDALFVVIPPSANPSSITEQPIISAGNIHWIQRDHSSLVKWGAHDPECTMVIRVMKTMKTKALAKQSGQVRTSSLPDLSEEFGYQRPPRYPSRFSFPSMLEGRPQQQSGPATDSQKLMESEIARATGLVTTKDYDVGWICAVGPEYVAALQLLDKRLSRPHDLSKDDENAYSFGIIGLHYVVIAGLAQGKYGLTSAASAATDMQRSFTAIRIRLLVGIAGGAPSENKDIRLGDVVISTPGRQRGGVLRYDSGRKIQNEEFERTGSLNSPPEFLLKAVMMLSSHHKGDGHNIKSTIENMIEKNPRLRKEYQKPNLTEDVLYKSSFIHSDNNKTCAELCFPQKDCIQPRPHRDISADDPVIHFGLVASGDQLMKDASVRDALASKEGVLCFEMEAAGLMGRFPCLVIRGICDYSDTHKNDLWQGYAAATAAAYAKELLVVAFPGITTPEEEDAVAMDGRKRHQTWGHGDFKK